VALLLLLSGWQTVLSGDSFQLATPKRDDDDDTVLQLGANIERWNPTGDYRSIVLGTFTVSAQTENNEVGLGWGVGNIDLVPGSSTSSQIENPVFVEYNIYARHYFAPCTWILRPYVSASASWMSAYWQYRQPVIHHYEKQETDSMQGLSGYVGAGLAVKIMKRINVFAEVGVGATGFTGITDAGIDHRYLGNFTYSGARTGINFSF
jgi:hypothetical protein